MSGEERRDTSAGGAVPVEGAASTGPVADKVVVGDADASTGNIVHEGMIRISGDVLNNILVSGRAGVQVMGSVYAGKIFSDGDITIFGDIAGRGEGTLIRAGRRLIVRSILNAAVVADTIVCQGSIKHSRVHAYNIIEAVAGTGEVVAAQVRAGNRFVSNTIGSPGEKDTLVDVELADKNVLLRNIFAIEEEQRNAHAELERLQRVVQVVKLMGDRVRELDAEKQAELKEKLKRVVELQGRIRELETRRAEFAGRLEGLAEKLEFYPVEVRQRVQRGTVIRIDGSELELPETILSGAGFFKKKRVQFKSF